MTEIELLASPQNFERSPTGDELVPRMALGT